MRSRGLLERAHSRPGARSRAPLAHPSRISATITARPPGLAERHPVATSGTGAPPHQKRVNFPVGARQSRTVNGGGRGGGPGLQRGAADRGWADLAGTFPSRGAAPPAPALDAPNPASSSEPPPPVPRAALSASSDRQLGSRAVTEDARTGCGPAHDLRNGDARRRAGSSPEGARATGRHEGEQDRGASGTGSATRASKDRGASGPGPPRLTPASRHARRVRGARLRPRSADGDGAGPPRAPAAAAPARDRAG